MTRGGNYTIATDGVGWLSGSNKVPALCRKRKGCAGQIATPSLAGLYEEIHSDAPNAAIRVLGYPEIFEAPASKKGSCVVGTFQSALGPIYNYSINNKNIIFLRSIHDDLDNLIIGQVNTARQAGVSDIQFVPTDVAFKGHALCGSEPATQVWVNPLQWSGDLLDPSSSSFHPNGQGQQEFTILVAASL